GSQRGTRPNPDLVLCGFVPPTASSNNFTVDRPITSARIGPHRFAALSSTNFTSANRSSHRLGNGNPRPTPPCIPRRTVCPHANATPRPPATPTARRTASTRPTPTSPATPSPPSPPPAPPPPPFSSPTR